MATIDEIRKKHGIVVNEVETVDPETNLTLSEKARLVAQGFGFNFSDEIIAGFRSLGDETYEEAVAEERAALDAARQKEGSLKYELGGAVLPALAAAPFTGGASIPLTLGRVAAVGGAQGFTSALGAGEGDIVERVTDDPAGLALATGLSAIAGPAGQKVVSAGQKVVSVLATPLKRGERILSGKLAKPVEDEVLRIAGEAGLTVGEIVRRVGEGEIIADMSEQATNAVRALYAKSGKGGQIISDAVSRRADELPADAKATLQADLVPDAATGNVTKYFDQSIDDLKAAEGGAYNSIFAKTANVKSNNLNLSVQEVLQNQKFLRNKVNALLSAKNKPPLFKVVDGQVELLEDVDLETAEIVRRALADKTSATFQKGEGSLGGAIGDLEKSLRNVIDEVSPELAATRANWAKIMNSKTAFEDGKRIFGKSADDAEVFFEDLVAKGDMEAVAALRAGAASALRAKSTTGAQVSMFKNFSDLNRKERLILEKLYPGDAAEAAFKKLELAAQSIQTAQKVLGGSPTAITEAGVKRIGTTQGLSDASSLLGGDLMAGVRLAKGFLGSRAESLSQAQLEQVAKLVVSEDADLLQRALTDGAARTALANKVNQIVNLMQRGGASAAAIETGEFVQTSPSIDSITKNVSPSTASKIQQAVN